MLPSLLAARSGIFAEGRFLGKILDEWADDTQEFIHLKLPHLLMVALIAFVLYRVLRLITARMIYIAELHGPGPGRVSQVKTLAGVIRTTGLAVISTIAGMQILDAVGINLAPLLTSAGIAGVAIGLAAQNIVRDMLNGVLILIEDQFNVGDTVHVAGVSGVVEAMTLRKTTVRDADGTLYSIPNSQVATVANYSRDFSVATLTLSVDATADPEHVLAHLRETALAVRNDPAFAEIALADPTIPGIDAINGRVVSYPISIRVATNQKDAILRELRRRILAAFEANDIPLGTDPNNILHLRQPDPTAKPTAPPLTDR